jgi:hypothetical protein
MDEVEVSPLQPEQLTQPESGTQAVVLLGRWLLRDSSRRFE